MPRTIWEVLHRQKDIQYSSRIASHIARQQQTHRLRHVVSQLVKQIPTEQRNSELVRDLAGYGCMTQMHVVRLLAPRIDNENHTKDIDFSALGIGARREAGYEAAMEALKRAPWEGEFDPIEGVILHEPEPDLRSPPNRPELYRHSPSRLAMREYDAIIIGTGQAGPSLARRLVAAGQKVAIIERKLFGGTCVNTGCTPTKAMVASAYAAHLARRAGDYGVTIGGPIGVDMKAVKRANRTPSPKPRGEASSAR